MRKISFLMMVVAVMGMMVSCERPEPSKPNDDSNNNTTDPTDDVEKEELPFDIVLAAKTQLSFVYNVYPEDKEMEYIFLTDTAKNFEKNGVVTGEDIVAFDIATFEREAEQYGTTLEEHVYKYYVHSGDIYDVEVNGIPPGDEFIIYAYGVKFEDGKLVATTEVVTLCDCTEEATMVELPLDIDIELNDFTATMTVEPGEFDGQYFALLERVDNFFPDTEPTVEQLEAMAMDIWYRTLALYLQFGFSLDSALADKCVVGTNTSSHTLLADSDYFAAAIPIDATTGVIYAYPSVKTFKTGSVEPSDNIIDISVSNIKPRSATVTVTPSNDDPYIVACFESAAFEGKSDKEIIAYYVENFPLYPLGGEFSYTFDGLSPNTDHFIAAFGCDGGQVTTELFRYDFKTLEEKVVDMDIKLDIVGYYDVAAVAALNSSYAAYEGYAALFVYDFVTTPEASGIYSGLYTKASTEGVSDDDLCAKLMSKQMKTNFRMVSIVSYYNLEYVVLAVAVDAEGNPSKLLKSEPIIFTQDGCRPAEEFISMMHP